MVISNVMSDLLYQVALGFDGPFTLEDITPLSNAERRKLAQQWLDELVERGELRRVAARRRDLQHLLLVGERVMPVEAMCGITGKRQMTYDVAKKAAERQRRARDHRVEAYHCRCGWWHVGSTPAKAKGRRFRS